MKSEDPRMPALNSSVTLAILRAERLAPGPEREIAFVEVSRIEEEIATICLAGTLEGDVARRGAITAAISARDWARGVTLVHRYLAESPSAPGLEDLKDEILRNIYGCPES